MPAKASSTRFLAPDEPLRSNSLGALVNAPAIRSIRQPEQRTSPANRSSIRCATVFRIIPKCLVASSFHYRPLLSIGAGSREQLLPAQNIFTLRRDALGR